MIYDKTLVETTYRVVLKIKDFKCNFDSIKKDYEDILQDYLNFHIKHINEKENVINIEGNLPRSFTHLYTLKVEEDQVILEFALMKTNCFRYLSDILRQLDKISLVFLKLLSKYVIIESNSYEVEMIGFNEYMQSVQTVEFNLLDKRNFYRLLKVNYKHLQKVPNWFKRHRYM